MKKSGHRKFSRKVTPVSGLIRYRIFALIGILLFGVATADPDVRRIDSPQNLLFVGNSFTFYNNGLHNHVRKMVVGAGKPVGITRAMTISGAKLSHHAPALRAQVGSAEWDVVVLQGHSLEAIRDEDIEGFRQAVRDFVRVIRESGASPVLFMTWARTNEPGQTALLNANYTAAGNETGSLVVPVGLAFEMSTRSENGIELRIDDLRHPTLAGSYLAACTFYAAMFDESPVGHPYTAGLSEEVAEALQRIAWSTVLSYYGDRH